MGRDGVVVPVVDHDQLCLKKKTAVSRSWILLDHNGQSKLLDVDKYVVMRRFQIHARDLRILDPMFSYPSTILGREKVIVLNLEHIKAIITAEEVLLRDPMDDNVIPIVEQLQRRLAPDNLITEGQEEDEEEHSRVRNDVDNGEQNGKCHIYIFFSYHCQENLHVIVTMGNCVELEMIFWAFGCLSLCNVDVEFPFEFRALEVALEAICSYLDARTRELETDAYPALEELISKISCRNLDRVRKLKSAMTRLTNRVQKVRDELEQLLDDDDDMADLYLSRKLTVASLPVSGSGAPDWFPNSPTIGSKISRASRASAAAATQEDNDVEELEMLLEAYYTQIDGTLNKLITLREYVDDTEDYINLQLDKHRNHLIQLELILSSGTVCVNVYSLVTAIFGMNIPYTWTQNHGYVFKWVVIISGVVSALFFSTIILYARRRGLFGS
ncbi:hypothetical protein EZV62_010757 [Acer yangbiense]|uniref:Magnesium transporter n=1 Tax=Acer yangbiense TaxID=1000413 RepID=A0A5C7I2M7_9ROSI|nr:hypothetical protein EZV62_010757 [Acer yangbiense]